MCLEKQELQKATDEQLLQYLIRATELKGGKSPFGNGENIKKEILRRMESSPQSIKTPA